MMTHPLESNLISAPAKRKLQKYEFKRNEHRPESSAKIVRQIMYRYHLKLLVNFRGLINCNDYRPTDGMIWRIVNDEIERL